MCIGGSGKPLANRGVVSHLRLADGKALSLIVHGPRSSDTKRRQSLWRVIGVRSLVSLAIMVHGCMTRPENCRSRRLCALRTRLKCSWKLYGLVEPTNTLPRKMYTHAISTHTGRTSYPQSIRAPLP